MCDVKRRHYKMTGGKLTNAFCGVFFLPTAPLTVQQANLETEAHQKCRCTACEMEMASH